MYLTERFILLQLNLVKGLGTEAEGHFKSSVYRPVPATINTKSPAFLSIQTYSRYFLGMEQALLNVNMLWSLIFPETRIKQSQPQPKLEPLPLNK